MSVADKLVTPDSAGAGPPDSAGAASGLRAASELRLLPCPFCGGDRINVERLPPGSPWATALVSCEDCGADGPVTARQSIGEAVYRWNTRPDPGVTAPLGPRPTEPQTDAAAEDCTFFLDL